MEKGYQLGKDRQLEENQLEDLKMEDEVLPPHLPYPYHPEKILRR